MTAGTRQRVLVTGGSSGIGLATAKAFASRGADVAIVARDPERLAAASAAIGEVAAGGRVLAVRGDVSTLPGATAAVESVIDGIGVPDVLVNTAGIIIPGYFESMSAEDFETCLRNGYLTCVYPSRALAPYLIERGSGHIINVSSMAGFVGCVFGYTAYASSKFAVMGFCEALRQEMKPLGIRVSVVCPPDTDTPGLAHERTLRPPETDAACANAKVIRPETVAAEILRAVDTGSYYVIPGVMNKVYFRLKGLLPGLFFAIFDSDVAKARKKRLAEAAGVVAAERE